MAVFDLQVYLQERFRAYDAGVDVSSGSPADVQVIQPLLRRLGVDPFTVDLATFLHDRLQQAFPEMATDEGDAITDLLIKPALLIWDPFVREIYRIRNCQSFKDPDALTIEEAEALGANLFSDRERGDYARGTGRIYYAQPRQASVTPINFFTSKGGLHFYPDGQQDITMEEMLLNSDGELYYFDVNLIAEAAGTGYNIDIGELVTVANMEGTARVTNLRRFSSGQNEESASEFIGRSQQDLTERSLVTIRGIGAQVPRAFPEVTRLAVVGAGDPEMQRDVVRGGGLGAILLGGVDGSTALDMEGRSRTRRFHVGENVDFTAVLDPLRLSSYVLTLHDAFADVPQVRDLVVTRVVDAQTLEVADQVLLPYMTRRCWTLRRSELTLSKIPGGILYPDSPLGTVTIPDGEVHVGGMFDVLVRGSSFDTATLAIENINDANPAVSGNLLVCPGDRLVELRDLTLGEPPDGTYAVGDAVYVALSQAKQYGFTLQILTGNNAGNYRVMDVVQITSGHPVLTLDADVPALPDSYKWRLVDVIDIDLTEPKDTRVSGDDLQSVQHLDELSTASSTDLSALGVSVNDVLRIEEGLDAGDYVVKALLAYNRVRVHKAMKATSSDLKYTIFRANSGGGMQLPLVRITKVELLDTSGQPVGSIVPYAKPIDIQSRSFENPGRGIRVDLTDARLGILTKKEPVTGFEPGGYTILICLYPNTQLITGNPTIMLPVIFYAGTTLTAVQLRDAINSVAHSYIGPGVELATLVKDNDRYRVGVNPIAPLVRIFGAPMIMSALFDTTTECTSLDVRSESIDWGAVVPPIDQSNLDVLQVLDGAQAGVYGYLRYSSSSPAALIVKNPYTQYTQSSFSPEVGRHVQVGSRSIGSARCFFLDPTSIEFNQATVFSATLSDGSEVRFMPDPTLDTARLPAYPSTSLPKTGVFTNATTFTDLSQNYVISSIVPGDVLVAKYVPITGSLALGASVPVNSLQVILSLNGNVDQYITLGHDTMSVPASDVTRASVVDQINRAVGKQIAKLTDTYYLEFEGDVSIIVRGVGTANVALGLPTVDTDNSAVNARSYSITGVSESALSISPAVSNTSETRIAYEIRRPGAQRTCSTQMQKQPSTAGLYYCDVELVSEGTGDIFNISAGVQLTAAGYRSDGYYLTTEDPDLTFSPVERPILHISRSILEVGVSDDPSNATQLTGQNIEITYERSTLTSDVQNFLSSETERVVCANPLSRHLVPHFVRFDFSYTGGSLSDVVRTDLLNYITGLFPNQLLEVGDLIDKAYRRGASSVTNPIDLIAVVHGYDRSVWAQRSQNALNTGRLAAFVPDVININRSSG